MRIVEWTAEDWDTFVDANPYGTIYSKSVFLAAYERPIRYWRCVKGDETIVGLAVLEEARNAVRLPFQQYNGLVFAPDGSKKLTTRLSVRYDATMALAEHLMAVYDRVHLVNTPDVVDVRPFKWTNYHAAEAPKFDVTVEYTTTLDISNPEDRSGYQVLRRRCANKAETLGLATERSSDVGLLAEMFGRTFARQGLDAGDKGPLLRRLGSALLPSGAARMYVTSQQGKPLSYTFFAVHRRRAYYVSGGGDPDGRASNAGTKVMVDTIAALNREAGVREIDFVGANSPMRGAFKLSFGGPLIPYFTAVKRDASVRQ